MKRKLTTILLGLSVLAIWSIQTAGIAAEDAAVPKVKQCQATTPVKNPWTKRMPQGWWVKRHEDILAAPGRKEAQIVFIGDSITDGWDSENAGLNVWKKEYVPMKALNLGINCDSTQHVLWRLDHGEVDDLANLKVAIVMIGVNNKGINRHKARDVAAGITAICGRLKKRAPHARILLLGVFPRFFGKDNNENVNKTISKLHDGKHIFYLNINNALLKEKGAIRDRVGHLSEKGYEIWAAQIRPTLRKLMRKQKHDPQAASRPAAAVEKTDPRIGYFMDVAIGAEFGDKAQVIKKWHQPIKFKISGSPTKQDMETLKALTAELKQLSSNINIQASQAEENHNCVIHFIPKKQFRDVIKKAERNCNGYMAFWWKRQYAIRKAIVLIASDIRQGVRSCVIREEVTQSLGIARDSNKYRDSVFHTRTDVPSYSEMDKFVITTLYRNDIKAGMALATVKKILKTPATTKAIESGASPAQEHR